MKQPTEVTEDEMREKLGNAVFDALAKEGIDVERVYYLPGKDIVKIVSMTTEKVSLGIIKTFQQKLEDYKQELMDLIIAELTPDYKDMESLAKEQKRIASELEGVKTIINIQFDEMQDYLDSRCIDISETKHRQLPKTKQPDIPESIASNTGC